MPSTTRKRLREFDRYVDATLRPDPRWLIIRRVKFATKVRDMIYGHQARPFGRVLRHSWARLLAFYTRSRMLTYSEVESVAWSVGRELRGGRMLVYDEDTDEQLRQTLSERLTTVARAKERMHGSGKPANYKAELRWERYIGQIRQAMLDDRCPLCRTDDPPALGCSTCRALRAQAASRSL